eukprot:14384486-Heterocapsa_arctica.AAC.1
MAPGAPAAPTTAAEQPILNPSKPGRRPWSCPSTSSTGPGGRHRARQDLRAQHLPLPTPASASCRTATSRGFRPPRTTARASRRQDTSGLAVGAIVVKDV